uniref:Uncharacterized protein n=1 Tax=Candidatus Kentrum sp. SD TaxID=2126332 RepID=A0A450YTC9_9GAMM|nr:MAG: hypothetical protein BECKSD772F_GA0070984_10432 [Candidatus Kentron sp. SD]VFK44773.1 MAG: hypothetical protein BECKSD772E_GA0070983_104319 [Candidatus Kentron sp. SD]
MWHSIVTMKDMAFGPIHALWIAPDGGELLLLAEEQTLYWNAWEDRALWSLRERRGGDGISPDGRIYRDLSSGLFYPLFGSHGGRESRAHATGGHIDVEDDQSGITVTDPQGRRQSLSHEGCANDKDPDDWRIITFCEFGDHILIACPCFLTVYASLP